MALTAIQKNYGPSYPPPRRSDPAAVVRIFAENAINSEFKKFRGLFYVHSPRCPLSFFALLFPYWNRLNNEKKFQAPQPYQREPYHCEL